VPSFSLINPTVWPQYTNVKDRTRQAGQTYRQTDRQRSDSIGRTVLQTVARKRFALCYRTVVLSACLSGYDVGVLWPNGWMDQDETWHGGRSRSRPHCIRREPSSLIRGTAPKFSAHVCCVANGWMDQDTIWFGGRPSPRPHCVRWGPFPADGKRHSSHNLLVHVYFGQKVARLSNC